VIKHIWTLPHSSRFAWLESLLAHPGEPEVTICHDGLTSGVDRSVIVATVAINYATTSTTLALESLIQYLQQQLDETRKRFP
jgi:hypothetical protein